MRSFVRSISMLGVPATSLAGCGAEDQGQELGTEGRASELLIAHAVSGSIADDQSYARVAVVPVNQSNFAVLYQHPADGMHHLVRYTIPAPGTPPAQQNPPQWNLGVDANLRGFTVRANTSPPLGRNKICALGSGAGQYNYAAVEQLGKISLDKHTFSTLCGGWLYNRLAIDDGSRPAVATKGFGTTGGRALVVYVSSGSVLRGRLLNWSVSFFTGAYSESLGSSFTIATPGESIVSTDVVYSPTSDKFIVGFTTQSSACRVWNIVLDASPATPTVSRGAMQFGVCGSTGPTPTNVALSTAAGGDMYLWSRTDMAGHRAVFGHSTTDGTLISFVSPLISDSSSGTNFTLPVAGSSNPNEPYVVLYGKGDGSLNPSETQIWAMDFPNRTFGRFENQFTPVGAPIAIGSAPTATIALSGIKDAGRPTMSLNLAISDMH